jgi:hypothetical protein
LASQVELQAEEQKASRSCCLEQYIDCRGADLFDYSAFSGKTGNGKTNCFVMEVENYF